jgi:hypothetical protein
MIKTITAIICNQSIRKTIKDDKTILFKNTPYKEKTPEKLYLQGS